MAFRPYPGQMALGLAQKGIKCRGYPDLASERIGFQMAKKEKSKQKPQKFEDRPTPCCNVGMKLFRDEYRCRKCGRIWAIA